MRKELAETMSMINWLELATTYVQGSAMTAKGEWRDGLCCLELPLASLNRAVHLQHVYLYTYSLVPRLPSHVEPGDEATIFIRRLHELH